MAAVVAKEFGLSPRAVLDELEDDPDQIAVVCVSLLRYAEAKAANDSNSEATMKAWAGSEVMQTVIENDHELAAEVAAREAKRG